MIEMNAGKNVPFDGRWIVPYSDCYAVITLLKYNWNRIEQRVELYYSLYSFDEMYALNALDEAEREAMRQLQERQKEEKKNDL